MRSIWLAFLMVIGLGIMARADESEPKLDPAEFRDVAGELRCPTCTGLSVLESDAAFSVQIKDMVKKQVAEGKDKQQILDFFVDRYGPWILRAPPKRGFHAVAWIVPIALLVIGPLGVWFFVWRRKRDFDTAGVRPSSEIFAEFEQRLQQARTRGET